MMYNDKIVPHLFRTEFSNIVAVLTKTFGYEYIETAEDTASETFLTALDTWPYRGTPANPEAWLYATAKNKFLNHLKRKKLFNSRIAEKLTDKSQTEEIDIDFSSNNILDSQLRMLFAICNPSLSAQSQICLALRVMCGFGLKEIADAFLCSKETVHKRLQRAKQKLKCITPPIGLTETHDINERLENVLYTIYLLFSEGYYSECSNDLIREECCIEAINLTGLLLGYPLTHTHASNSLMSLMCFQSSRIKARKSTDGSIILYDEQDRNLWDTAFIEKGFYYLQQASRWDITSKYYIEASIAYWHTTDNRNQDKWRSILALYDALMTLDMSPVVSLNRMWAYSKVHGSAAAIHEIGKMDGVNCHFAYLLLAELYKDTDPVKSMENYRTALGLCKTDIQKKQIQNKMTSLTI